MFSQIWAGKWLPVVTPLAEARGSADWAVGKQIATAEIRPMSPFHRYVPSKSVILVMLEGILIVLAVLCGVAIRFWNQPAELEGILRFPDFGWRILMVLVTLQICFYYCDLYDLTVFGRSWRRLVGLLQSLGAGCLILGFAYFLFPKLLIGRGVLVISITLIGFSVFLCRWAVDRAWDLARMRQNVLIIGTHEFAATVARELEQRREDFNFQLAGFVDPGPGRNGNHEEVQGPILGGVKDLPALVQGHRISRIIVALEDRRGALPVNALVKLRMMGVQIDDAQTTLAALTGRVWLSLLQPSWFIFSGGFRRSHWILMLKRATDIVLALAGLILTGPLMLLLALIIRLDSRGAALFRQTRVGLNGRQFDVLKFRSMRVDAETNGAQWAQKDDPRVTRAGRLLRKMRLDELPQFINILCGDMSFVGPRPERPVFVEELERSIPFYEERHLVRPGLTGWAQVEYCYGASVEDAAKKLEYDLFYMKNMSFFFDLLIVLKTIKVVMSGSKGR
jgi:sugar transferase (PEP-CTERM system associated)